MVDYGVYKHLLVDRQDGIALFTMNRPEVYNATNGRLHYELGRIWLDIGADADVRVSVITGAGKAFSAGGDLDLIEAFLDTYPVDATLLGVHDRDDRLTDYSEAGDASLRVRLAEIGERCQAIDPAALDIEDRLTRSVVAHLIETAHDQLDVRAIDSRMR
jgi:hypothetical protein